MISFSHFWAHSQLSRYLKHVTGDMPLFVQKTRTPHDNSCRSSDTPACRATVVRSDTSSELISGSCTNHFYLVTNIVT